MQRGCARTPLARNLAFAFLAQYLFLLWPMEIVSRAIVMFRALAVTTTSVVLIISCVIALCLISIGFSKSVIV